jgi:predicted O-methyltransferase YrrM
MTSFLKPVKETLKAIAFKHLGLGAPSYPYCIEPIQLATLINEFERVKDLEGCVIEIGVARGMTSRFLAEHIKNQQLADKTSYYAIDTFESFTKADLDYEVQARGKNLLDLRGFEYNDFEVWKKNFVDFPFVHAIKSDCATFDYTTLGAIKLAFLDVDLYLPINKTLPKLYDALVEGGAIVVDDVLNNTTYDGAYQAYMEFCEVRSIKPIVIGNRCGLIIKK